MHTLLLDHASAIRDGAQRLRLTARLDLSSFRLAVGGRNRNLELFPRFITFRDGAPGYSSVMDEDSTGFLGWLPYAGRRSPVSADKLAFKEFCSDHDLPTPPHWSSPDPSMRDFIVKPRVPSAGHRIRGPFKAFDPAAPEQALLDDEYCEQFRAGSIAKAWYWNDRLVCLDVREMPADFRTTPGLPLKRAPDVLAQYAGTSAERQLSDAGPVLWHSLADAARKNTLWTVDAIFEEDQVWLLEMNCSPVVHPQAYFPMLEGLFGQPEAVSEVRVSHEVTRPISSPAQAVLPSPVAL